MLTFSLTLLSLSHLALSTHLQTKQHISLRQFTPLTSNASLVPSLTSADEEEDDSFMYYDASNDSDDDWFDLTPGLMVFNGDESEYGATGVETYGEGLQKRGISSRDTKRGMVEMGKGADGALGFVKRAAKGVEEMVRKVKRASSWSVVITWYDGNDLKNPSCGNKSKFTPTDSSMIFARTIKWSGGPNCGDFVLLCAKNNKKKCVYVREWDTCGGCTPNVPHIDLTKGAFAKLYDLDVGLVSGISAKKVAQPFKTWGSAQTKAYGPETQ